MKIFLASRMASPVTEIPKRTLEARVSSRFSNMGERSKRMRNVRLK